MNILNNTNAGYLYALFPALCMLVGGSIAAVYQPKAKLLSAVQHFAAGVVFAAVAVEFIPKLLNTHATNSIAIGFIAGVLLMLIVKRMSSGMEARSSAEEKLPMSLLLVVGIDLLIDGVLIGIAFLVGEQGGMLITLALAIEIILLRLIFFCGCEG